jgi:hypothetical protein
MARSVSILAIRMVQIRCRSRKNLRAFAAVVAGRMRTNTRLVAPLSVCASTYAGQRVDGHEEIMTFKGKKATAQPEMFD